MVKSKSPVDFEKIYGDFIKSENDNNREDRYKGKEEVSR